MKKTNSSRAAALILSVVIVLTLFSACGGGGSGEDAGDSDGYVYVPQYTQLPEEITNVNQVCITGESLFISTYEYAYGDGPIAYDERAKAYAATSSAMPEVNTETEQVVGTSSTKIYRINADGTGCRELAEYRLTSAPEGVMGEMSLMMMTADGEGGLWVAETGSFYHYDAPEGVDEFSEEYWKYYVEDTAVNVLRRLDPETGAELQRIDLAALSTPGEYFYLAGLQFAADGAIIIFDGNKTVYAIDGSGAVLFQLTVETWLNALVKEADGKVSAMIFDESNGGYSLKEVDMAAKAWGEAVALPQDAYSTYAGNSEFPLLYSSSINLYSYDTGTETSTKLLNWISSNIDNNNIRSLGILPDGRILCVASSYDYSSYEIVILTKTPVSELPEKTTLTMACMYLDQTLRSVIINFNKTSDSHRIEVTDYSEYNTGEDYNAGLLKLTTEITSGNIPDIIDVNGLPIDQFAGKGLLEDLNPYINNDEELSDSFMESIRKAMEKDGALYQISSSFYIQTVIGRGSVVGHDRGWTLDDLKAVMADSPEGTSVFMPYITRDSILYYCLQTGMNEYVDWQTGECNFDSDSFKDLLEFANSFPAEFDWEKDWGVNDSEQKLLMTGKVLLSIYTLADFVEFQSYKQLFEGDISLIGFPTQSKNGSAMTVNGGLAMSASCKDKEGAWQLMRTILTEEYQTNNMWWGFPTNKTVFDEKLQTAMTPDYYTDENGNQVESPKSSIWIDENNQIDVYAISREEADEILDFIETVDHTASYNQSVMEIIQDETAAYFAGQKSAGDTAAVIQSRVNIYVNEQR